MVPREEGRFEPRTDGHCCQADAGNLLVACFRHLQRAAVLRQRKKDRAGHLSFARPGKCFTSSHMVAAAELLAENNFASKGMTSLSQEKECQL